MAYSAVPMDNTNLAYDLSKFDVSEKRQREEQSSKNKIHLAPAVSVSKSGSKIKVAFASFLALAAFSAVNVSNTMKDDAARLVEQQQNTLQGVRDENAALQSKLDSKVNTAYIEQYASEKLGMIKTSASQKKYISVNTESLVEVEAEENLGVIGGVRAWFDSVLEYIGF